MNVAMNFESSLHDLEAVMTQPTQAQQSLSTTPSSITPGVASANIYKQ
jgi:hypothetical protein